MSETNKKRRLNAKELTIEKLRDFKGFENVSEEEAQKVVDSIKELCLIMYHSYQTTLKKEYETSKHIAKSSKAGKECQESYQRKGE